MIPQAVISYIADQRGQGFSDEEIRNVLKEDGGWSDEEVDQAFQQVDGATGEQEAQETESEQVPGTAESADTGDTEGKSQTDEAEEESKEPSSRASTQQDTKDEPSTGNGASSQRSSQKQESDSQSGGSREKKTSQATPNKGEKKKQKNAAQALDDIPQSDESSQKAPSSSTDTSSSNTSGTVIAFVLIFLILVVAAAGGVYAYYTYFKTDYNKILTDAIVNNYQNIDSVKTARGKLNAEVTGKVVTMPSEMTLGATFETGFDLSKERDPRVRYRVAFSGIPLSPDGEPTFDPSVEFRLAEKNGFVQLNGLPSNIPMVPDHATNTTQAISTVTDTLNGTWLAITKESIIKTASSTRGLSERERQQMAMNIDMFKRTVLSQMNSRVQTGLEKAKTRMQPLLDVYKKHPFVRVKKVVSANASVNSQDAYHMRLTVDPNTLVAFIDKAGKHIDTNAEQLSKKEKQQIKTIMKAANRTVMKAFSTAQFDVWITKDDKQIAKQQFEFSVDPKTYITQYNTLISENTDLENISEENKIEQLPEEVDLSEISFSGMFERGESAQIGVPEKNLMPLNEAVSRIRDDINAKQVITELQRVQKQYENLWQQTKIFNPLNEARRRGQDASLKSSLSAARSEAQLYYSDNQNSYDGVCESENLSDLMQPLEDDGYDVMCRANATEYLIYAPLKIQEEGTYWCVDSTGFSGALEEEPTGMSCSSE